MLIGYVRVSKSDGTQTLAPQRDALLAAGVEPERIYEDLASGRHDARPGLAACLKALQSGNTLVLWNFSIRASLIPSASFDDRCGPGAMGDGGEALGRVHQFVPSVAAGIHDGVVAVPDAVAEKVGAQVGP